MKNIYIRFLTAFMTMTLFVTCSKDKSIIDSNGQDNSGRYINGTYQGETRIDREGYHALASVTVTRNRIEIADWQIYDNYRKRYFDASYEEVYTGNNHYMQQCRDNMVGMNMFGPALIETQDIHEVDNITGATWCYKKFKEVMNIALKDASVDTTAQTD